MGLKRRGRARATHRAPEDRRAWEAPAHDEALAGEIPSPAEPVSGGRLLLAYRRLLTPGVSRRIIARGGTVRANQYSNGSTLAELSQNQITASCGRGEYCGARIQVINEAFRLYYRYRRAIEPLSRTNWNAYWAMWRELEDAGDTGWGIGVCDLDDAFDHLIRNGGRWTDENTKPYWGLNLPSVYRQQIFDAPMAAANFLTAVNGKLRRLANLLDRYRNVAQRPGEVQGKLRELREIAEEAQTLAWILPEEGTPEDLYDRLIEGLDRLNQAVEVLETMGVGFRRSVQTVLTVSDWLTRADEAARTFVSAREAGMDSRVAAAWAVLGQAVSYVPVLGGFYSEIVNQAPGLVAGFRRLVQDYTRRIDRLSSAR